MAVLRGIGPSKRVVVWDTTIRKMTTGEILFVFGHEMGHYVLSPIRITVAMVCGVLLLFLGYHSARWLLARWGAAGRFAAWTIGPRCRRCCWRWRCSASPPSRVANSFSRVLEHNADVYGLEAIHGIVPDSPQAAAAAFRILGEIALSDPNPNGLIKFWLYDHPPVSERVVSPRSTTRGAAAASRSM